MGLETGTSIADLVITNPTSSDAKSQGDDHFRLAKTVLRNCFAGFTGNILVSGTDGGAADAYTLTPTTTLTAYSTKMLVEFTPNATNTGASTLNISGLGAKNIFSVAGAALSAGELVSGRYYLAAYDGTQFRLLSVTKAYIDALTIAAGNVAAGGTSGQVYKKNSATDFDAGWSDLKTVNGQSLPGSGDIAITSGLTLIATLTPTAAANVDFLTAFTSTYDNYLVIIDGIKPAADDSLNMRLAVAGSADSGSNYAVRNYAGSSSATTATEFTTLASTATSAGKGASGQFTLTNVNTAATIKSLNTAFISQNAATPTYVSVSQLSAYVAASVVTGFRLYWAGGSNFAATGTVRVYGYANT